jgi:hypothetical protein
MQAPSFFVRCRIVSLQGFGSDPERLERKDRKKIGKNRSFRVCQNRRNSWLWRARQTARVKFLSLARLLNNSRRPYFALRLPADGAIWYGPAEGETTMTKTHFSNLILAAVFSTAMAAPAIAFASSSMPVNAGTSARATAPHGTLVAGTTRGDDKKDDKKSDKKEKADKGGKKDKAPAPTGGGW